MIEKNIKSISIIIVNFNGKHFLQDCLTSVLLQDYPTFEVIGVDNTSIDGSIEFLNKNFPQVHVIKSDKNLGFAGGNNLGIENTKGELIVLLNNDTVVHQGWLQGLANAIADENVAAVSSLIKTEGIPDKYYEKNGSINFLGHNIMRIFDEPTDIFFAGGASMIFRKDIIGIPFDEDYFVYGEDVYLGLRVRFMGYQVKHTNESILDHFGNGTSKSQKSDFLTFYQERNRLLNTFLFFTPRTILKVAPFIVINCIAKIFASLLGMKYSFIGLLKAYGWFVIHIPLIINKRRALRSEQKVEEAKVIRYMTGKLTNGESTVGKLLNAISLLYCRIVNIKVIELSK
jgi:GT2 family glycosyltransferase